MPADVIAKVGRSIRATAHANADPADADELVLLDADLSILGAEAERYAKYAAAIRREYVHVEESAYRAGRRRVLESFLARPRIYRTERLFAVGEAAARANIAGEITRMERG